MIVYWQLELGVVSINALNDLHTTAIYRGAVLHRSNNRYARMTFAIRATWEHGSPSFCDMRQCLSKCCARVFHILDPISESLSVFTKSCPNNGVGLVSCWTQGFLLRAYLLTDTLVDKSFPIRNWSGTLILTRGCEVTQVKPAIHLTD